MQPSNTLLQDIQGGVYDLAKWLKQVGDKAHEINRMGMRETVKAGRLNVPLRAYDL